MNLVHECRSSSPRIIMYISRGPYIYTKPFSSTKKISSVRDFKLRVKQAKKEAIGN